jgi:hypothetical protein
MYKGKGALGVDPASEMRSKKFPKDVRRTSGAYSNEQAKMDSYHNKN